MYAPNTVVNLCAGCPLYSDSKNQLLFNTASGQLAYFNGLVRYSFNDFTYQRKDNIIRVGINADELMSNGINYCFYDNAHYTGKWFYCFIEKIEFINENCSALHIKTDVFQAWLFDMEIKQSFIERETVLNDDLFKNTLPESIGEIEYKSSDAVGMPAFVDSSESIDTLLSGMTADNFNNNYYCCVFMSDIIKYIGTIRPSIDSFVGGSPNPCYIYATDLAGYWELMNKINENGQADAVVKCVAIPKFMCRYHSLQNDPTPPTPPVPSANNYLGSPFSNRFTISQAYGENGHDGIDMWCLYDDNIYTTVSGTVVYSAKHEASYPGGSFGELVCVQDSNTGYYFLFAHLSVRGVSQGDTVNRGDYIGVIGDSGDADGIHLHYEVNTTDMWSNSINPVTVAGAQYPNEDGTY